MSNGAITSMCWYKGTKDYEEKKLMEIDNDVAKWVIDNKGVESSRPWWIEGSDKDNHRIVRLVTIANPEEELFKLTEDEVATLSSKEILSKLYNSKREG